MTSPFTNTSQVDINIFKKHTLLVMKQKPAAIYDQNSKLLLIKNLFYSI